MPVHNLLSILLLDCFSFLNNCQSSSFHYWVSQSNQKRTSNNSHYPPAHQTVCIQKPKDELLVLCKAIPPLQKFCSLPPARSFIFSPLNHCLLFFSPKNRSTFPLPCFLFRVPHYPFTFLCGTAVASIVCTWFLQVLSSQSFFHSSFLPLLLHRNYSCQITNKPHLTSPCKSQSSSPLPCLPHLS